MMMLSLDNMGKSIDLNAGFSSIQENSIDRAYELGSIGTNVRANALENIKSTSNESVSPSLNGMEGRNLNNSRGDDIVKIDDGFSLDLAKENEQEKATVKADTNNPLTSPGTSSGEGTNKNEVVFKKL